MELPYNIESNLVGETLILGFAQTAGNDEVRKYCQKGVKLSREIISSLSKFLEHDNINHPVTGIRRLLEILHPHFQIN